MAKLPRILQKIFGLTGVVSDFGEIGSDNAGVPTTTKDLDQIQSRAEYGDGLSALTNSAAEPPRMEDFNSLFLLFANQIKYLFQQGVAEWDVDENYYVNSIAQKDGDVYMAVTGTDPSPNIGNDPVGDTVNWRKLHGLNSMFFDSLQQLYINTGRVTIDNSSTGDVFLDMKTPESGHENLISIYKNSELRWRYGQNNSAETGGNAGANFEVRAFNDAGTFLRNAMVINRANGHVFFPYNTSIGNSSQSYRLYVYEDTPPVNGDKVIAEFWGSSVDGCHVSLVNGTKRWTLGLDNANSNFKIKQDSGNSSATLNITTGGDLFVTGGYDVIYRNASGVESVAYTKKKVIEIGPWVIATATAQLSIPHGLTGTELLNVVNVNVVIRRDQGDLVFPLTSYDKNAGNGDSRGVSIVDSTNVRVIAEDNLFRNSADFDDSVINRGWVIVEYMM